MTSTKEKKVAATTSTNTINTFNNTTNYSSQIPEHIDQKHWNEWISKGVKPEIISRNVRTIKDSVGIDRILNRNNKSRWKHSDNLIPAWAVTGIDPRTDEPTLLGAQVKPDTPLLDKNGKIQKYLSASGYQLAPLFLDIGIEGYWQEIINNKSVPMFITEGAKKAAAGLSIGHITVSIPGVSTCRKNGRLHELLQLFCGFGRTFYLAFDNDAITKKPVQDALIGMAKELAATGSKVMVVLLPPGESKGMDDFIADHGEDEFNKLVADAKTIEEWRRTLEEEWVKKQLEEEDEQDKCKLKRQFEIIRDGWGERLRYNQLKNQIELAGQVLEIEQVRLRMALEFNEAVPIGDAEAIVEMLAQKNSYNPVLEYLDSLEYVYPSIDPSILDNLATRYFGTDDPIYDIYMKKTLLAAVARVREPGCKHDCATVLVGKQGWFKSTFWKILFSEEWFSDELGDANEKDELMKLHCFWGLEWSEFETVYKRKDVSALKKFMTSTTDAFRTPYGRRIKEYPRLSVLVGTTNETEILNDPTGSRRFWIIPLMQRIPIKLLREERDRIWAAANAYYQAHKGERHLWDLNDDESDRQEELNREFQVRDPWEENIKIFLSTKEYVTTDQVLTHLGVEMGRQDIALSRRVSSILRRLEWRYTYKRFDTGLLRVWISEKNKKLGFLEGSEGSEGSAIFNPNTPPQPYTEALTVTNEQTQQKLDINTGVFDEKEKDQPQQSPTENKEFQPPTSTTDPADPSDPSGKPNFLKKSDSVTYTLGGVYYLTTEECEITLNRVNSAAGTGEGTTEKTPPQTVQFFLENLQHLTPVFKPGDRVRVLDEKKHENKTYIVSSFHTGKYWLKADTQGFAKPIGEFKASQLEKL